MRDNVIKSVSISEEEVTIKADKIILPKEVITEE